MLVATDKSALGYASKAGVFSPPILLVVIVPDPLDINRLFPPTSCIVFT